MRENREPPLSSVRCNTERVGKVKAEANDERQWGVGQPHSTNEAVEQNEQGGGNRGGKEVGQGEYDSI